MNEEDENIQILSIDQENQFKDFLVEMNKYRYPSIQWSEYVDISESLKLFVEKYGAKNSKINSESVAKFIKSLSEVGYKKIID